jgi:hypothetical protein
MPDKRESTICLQAMQDEDVYSHDNQRVLPEPLAKRLSWRSPHKWILGYMHKQHGQCFAHLHMLHDVERRPND